MDTKIEPLADDLIRAVELLSETFSAKSISYALIGGLATTLRSRPRFTQDVDILLSVPQIVLPAVLDELVERGFTLDRETVLRQYTREHFTSFLFGSVRIDWLKPVLPLYTRAINDASPLTWTEGHLVRVASVRNEWSALSAGEEARTDWFEDAIARLVDKS